MQYITMPILGAEVVDALNIEESEQLRVAIVRVHGEADRADRHPKERL
jgi:hypothetical protein